MLWRAVLVMASASHVAAQQKPVAPDGWKLVWSDEFNGTGLDAKKWNVLIREQSKQPTHWLYPQNRDWAMEELMAKAVEEKRERPIPEARPWYSEIDIMEFLGHEPNVFYGTLHYRTFAGERKTSSVTWKADFGRKRGMNGQDKARR